MSFENQTSSSSEAAERMRQLGLDIQEAHAAGDAEKEAALIEDLRRVAREATEPIDADKLIEDWTKRGVMDRSGHFVEKKSNERERAA